MANLQVLMDVETGEDKIPVRIAPAPGGGAFLVFGRPIEMLPLQAAELEELLSALELVRGPEPGPTEGDATE